MLTVKSPIPSSPVLGQAKASSAEHGVPKTTISDSIAEVGKARNGKHASVFVVKLPEDVTQPICEWLWVSSAKSSNVGGSWVFSASTDAALIARAMDSRRSIAARTWVYGNLDIL